MTVPDDITELLARSALGDRAAFRDLYAATSGKLFATLLRILRDREISRDVLQEVYVKIWENAARFDAARSSPITWMVTIARNRALDHVRRAGIETIDIDDETVVVPSVSDHPMAGRERREALARLLGCLDGLDEQRRQAILLAYYHGHSRESLAGRFARPVATIKTWLHRSLAQLRGCLET